MLMKILDVLLSAVRVGAFLYIALSTFDFIRIVVDAAFDFMVKKTIELKQRTRRKHHENRANQRERSGEKEVGVWR